MLLAAKHAGQRRYGSHGSDPEDERPLHEVGPAALDLRFQSREPDLHLMSQLREVGADRGGFVHPRHEILPGFCTEKLAQPASDMGRDGHGIIIIVPAVVAVINRLQRTAVASGRTGRRPMGDLRGWSTNGVVPDGVLQFAQMKTLSAR